MSEKTKRPVTFAGLIARLNRKLALDEQKLFPEPGRSGEYYVENRVNMKRVQSGLSIDDLVKLARWIGALTDDDEFVG